MILHLGWNCLFFFLNVNKILNVGYSDLFIIRDTPLPQDELGTMIG